MPEYTERMNLPLPLGNEPATRAKYRELIEAIDEAAAADSDLTGHAEAEVIDHPDGSITLVKLAAEVLAEMGGLHPFLMGGY